MTNDPSRAGSPIESYARTTTKPYREPGMLVRLALADGSSFVAFWPHTDLREWPREGVVVVEIKDRSGSHRISILVSDLTLAEVVRIAGPRAAVRRK